MSKIKLTIPEPQLWYAYKDEKHFFKWLESISSVKKVVHRGVRLELTLEDPLSDGDLMDLIALLKRYRLNMTCLRVLCNSSNQHWFKRSNKFWYRQVFGRQK